MKKQIKYPKNLGSTGAAKDFLGLDRNNPNYNYVANIFWDACEHIAKLESENESWRITNAENTELMEAMASRIKELESIDET